jgi:hypothetical protein
MTGISISKMYLSALVVQCSYPALSTDHAPIVAAVGWAVFPGVDKSQNIVEM